MSRLGTTGAIAQARHQQGDPLAEIVTAFRLQTHRGNRVPVGLYQDAACTIPASEHGDPVRAWRDEITGSGVIAVNDPFNGTFDTTLEFVAGVPWIKSTANTCFVIESISTYFDGEAAIAAAYNPAAGNYTIVSQDDLTSYSGHMDCFFANDSQYSSLFLSSDRPGPVRVMPLSGNHTLTTAHDGTVWDTWLDGVPAGPQELAFGFKGLDKLYLMGGMVLGGSNAHFSGFIAGPAWVEEDRIKVEEHLRSLQPKFLSIAFFGDSNTAGTVIGSENAPPARTAAALLDRHILCSANNQGVSGTTSEDWAGDVSSYLASLTTETRVVVMLGTNNCKTSVATSKASFKSDMTAIVNEIIGSGRTPILLPAPYPEDGALGAWNAASAGLAASYNAALQEIAAEVSGCQFLETGLYAYTRDTPGSMTDGVHLSVTASQWLAVKLADYLEPLAD